MHKPLQDSTKYQVAVFYPEGWVQYGKVRMCASLDDAQKERRVLLSLGHEHVHIWTVTTELIET